MEGWRQIGGRRKTDRRKKKEDKAGKMRGQIAGRRKIEGERRK